MVRFLLYVGVSCFFVSQAGFAMLTAEELERVQVTYKAWSEEMQDSPAQDGTPAREGNPHLHDKNLSLGLDDEGAVLKDSSAPSGGDFCRLCDKCFGISAGDLRPFDDVLSDFRGAASGQGLAMLTHPDASNVISRALLPRVDWVNSRVYDTFSMSIIEGLQSASGTTSACYNAFFIGLVTAILGKEEARLRGEPERHRRQIEEKEFVEALALSRREADRALHARQEREERELKEALARSLAEPAPTSPSWWMEVPLSEDDQLAMLEAMGEGGAAASKGATNVQDGEKELDRALAVALALSLREF